MNDTDIAEVKRNLNKPVRYINKHLFIDADYILTGCIIRRNGRGFYYQAELRDMQSKSIAVARLQDISAKGDEQIGIDGKTGAEDTLHGIIKQDIDNNGN